MATYWLVTMFDENQRKEQFHMTAATCADAMDWVTHTLVKKNAINYQPVEVHVQLLTPREAGALMRGKP